jgi:hypothetical protein
MRSALLVLLLTFVGFPAAAEDGNSSLYTRSLVAYVQAKQEQVRSRHAVVVIENIVVDDPTFVYPLPSKVGSVRVEILSAELLKAKFKETGKQFDAVEIKPMINSRDELIVDCAEFRVSVKKRRVNLIVVGGLRFHWRFDVTKGDYAVVRIEPWRPQM